MNKSERHYKLPAVGRLLHCQELGDINAAVPRAVLVDWIRQAIEQNRNNSIDRQDVSPEQLRQNIIAAVRRRAEVDLQTALRPVINATGIILHTNLGRAPLAQRAVQRMQEASAYTNLEFGLESGKRSRRAVRTTQLLSQLTGAEDALVVNNCAAATLLVLQTMAQGREVVISRGQLVEIGGGFRLPEVFQAAGVVLREVGTTNRTYARDYQDAIHEATAAIIRVHNSNFAQAGFVASPSLAELVATANQKELPVIDDVGSGCLYDLSRFGLSEPSVIDSIRTGATVCLFSGDKLFGGPQCGMVVGKRRWIERLRANPLMRALRADKVTLAALDATAEIHLYGKAFEEVPVLRMLSQDAAVIQKRCIDARELLAESARRRVSIAACNSYIGGGALPGQALASFGLTIGGTHPDALARSLRLGTPAIHGRVTEERLWLDLRTVDASEIAPLARRLNELIGDGGESLKRDAC